MTKFTPREKELLKHLRSSLNNKQIGEKMNISEKTVKAMNTKLFKKLGVLNRMHYIFKDKSND